MASIKSTIILGGGPAGCECALWLKMLGLPVVLIEQTDKLGGLQVQSPYPNDWIVGWMNMTGCMIAQKMEDHINQMEIPVLRSSTISSCEKLPQGFSVTVNKKTIQAAYLVIATGVIPKSASFCAAENVIVGPGEKVFNYDFANKRIAVLGSGDNAAENYVFIKTKHPRVCHLYGRTIRARKNLWEQVDEQDVFMYPYRVDQTKMKITHHDTARDYDVFVVLLGWQANFPPALAVFKTDLVNKHGFIATDAHCRTHIKSIYAIGEVANRMHPCVITAMADGIVAAKSIHEASEKL